MSDHPSDSHVPASSQADSAAAAATENVSLGPACGVILLLVALTGSVLFTLGAFLLRGKQPQHAIASIQRQLIPWIEESQLSDPDKNRITGRLNELLVAIERDEISSRQLQRLYHRLSENPVLQWAPLELAIAQANGSGEYTDAERAHLQSLSDRLLQAAGQGRISINELEFVLQPITLRNSKSGRLILKEPLLHNDVLTSVQRGEELLKSRELQDIPVVDASVGQVFDRMIDEALNEDMALSITR